MPDPKKKCFIIMPLTTPEQYWSRYHGDKEHFRNVLDGLFLPAIDKADMDPIKPIARGADLIHREIIKNLETADLVLCDMSIFNPNVFFELGVRVSLNKPICLVKDDKTAAPPFDVVPINYKLYNGLPIWNNQKEIEALAEHIQQSISTSDGKNWLWQVLSFNIKAEPLTPTSDIGAKMDYLIQRVETMAVERTSPSSLLRLALTNQEREWSEKRTNMIDEFRRLGLFVAVVSSKIGGEFSAEFVEPITFAQRAMIESVAQTYDFNPVFQDGGRYDFFKKGPLKI